MMVDRREFMLRLARGAAYVAPVVVTLSTPRELRAVVTSGMIMLMNQVETVTPNEVQAPWTEPAPWQRDPPGSSPPSAPTPPDPGSGRE